MAKQASPRSARRTTRRDAAPGTAGDGGDSGRCAAGAGHRHARRGAGGAARARRPRCTRDRGGGASVSAHCRGARGAAGGGYAGAAGLCGGRLPATTRHHAPGRRHLGADDGGERGNHRGGGGFRVEGLRPATGPARGAAVADLLVGAAGHGECAEPAVHQHRPVQPLCGARTPHLRSHTRRCPQGGRGDGAGGASLPALRGVRLDALSARHRTDLWRLWHAGHGGDRSARHTQCGNAGCGGFRDRGAPCQDGAVSLSPVAAAGPCRSTRGGQRGALRTRRQGQPVPADAALVRHLSGAARACRHAAPRAARCLRRDHRQCHGVAPAAPQAACRLLDGGADRLHVLRLHAGAEECQRRHRRNGLDRRVAAGGGACLRQGGDVPRGRARRGSAWT